MQVFGLLICSHSAATLYWFIKEQHHSRFRTVTEWVKLRRSQINELTLFLVYLKGGKSFWGYFEKIFHHIQLTASLPVSRRRWLTAPNITLSFVGSQISIFTLSHLDAPPHLWLPTRIDLLVMRSVVKDLQIIIIHLFPPGERVDRRRWTADEWLAAAQPETLRWWTA